MKELNLKISFASVSARCGYSDVYLFLEDPPVEFDNVVIMVPGGPDVAFNLLRGMGISIKEAWRTGRAVAEEIEIPADLKASV